VGPDEQRANEPVYEASLSRFQRAQLSLISNPAAGAAHLPPPKARAEKNPAAIRVSGKVAAIRVPARLPASMAQSRRGDGGGGDGGGGGVKVAPNLSLDRESTRVLNLSVLQRLDPAVTDILITAAHVVSYSFDEVIEEWVQYRSKTPALSRPISFRCNSDS